MGNRRIKSNRIKLDNYEMIELRFPDGTLMEYEKGITPREIVSRISQSLLDVTEYILIDPGLDGSFTLRLGLDTPVYFSGDIRLYTKFDLALELKGVK